MIRTGKANYGCQKVMRTHALKSVTVAWKVLPVRGIAVEVSMFWAMLTVPQGVAVEGL